MNNKIKDLRKELAVLKKQNAKLQKESELKERTKELKREIFKHKHRHLVSAYTGVKSSLKRGAGVIVASAKKIELGKRLAAYNRTVKQKPSRIVQSRLPSQVMQYRRPTAKEDHAAMAAYARNPFG